MADPDQAAREGAHPGGQPVDGRVFIAWMSAGLTWLKTNVDLVNSLNVFPVPDGDTGTNMLLTMQAAVFEAGQADGSALGVHAQAFAQGALMGARGNSGVILSQIWRGFARAMEGHTELSVPLLARAFSEARDTAYRGVVRPVEGTILTVTKDMAETAEKLSGETEDIVQFLEHIVEAADASVQRTPELLPVLKDAGVVDSGGKGLYYIFDGALRHLHGEPLDEPEFEVRSLADMDFESVMGEVEEGQDYEIIVDFRPHGGFDLQKFYADLEKMGTSIQVGEGSRMYRMHIHVPTENRYLPIDYAMEIGTITKVHIENLMAQMEEIEARAKEKFSVAPVGLGQIAVVTVSPGSGISKVFASLGANAVVGGGQTMNPSTKEIVEAFEDLPTDRVIVLPNNKNIIMAAEAARELTVKNLAVIPSRTIPQGLAAMLLFDAEGDFDEIVAAMKEAIEEVQTGEITTAVRSVEIDGIRVEEGQIIALHNGKLVLASEDLVEGCLAFLEHAEAGDYELITMFFGKDVTRSEADDIAARIQEIYPDHEIEVQDGGQSHYQFIFSVE
ncbi:MAG TPA: DAK2 domain-containing protein [Anaerolineales bacterium]|nr:DAK2 domain-containing protein [Anaerolineales bacterium]